MTWTLLVDQTYTLSGGQQYGESKVTLYDVTGRQLVVYANNPNAQSDWTRAGRVFLNRSFDLSLPDPVDARSAPYELWLTTYTVIEVPPVFGASYQVELLFLSWHAQMELQVWQSFESIGPQPGEFKDLAFNVGSGGWTDDNGYYWVVAAGGTIGAAGSGANLTGPHLERLYKRLWPHYPVANKGSSANADWIAGKALTLPDLRGRTRITAGQGPSLTNRTIAQVLGRLGQLAAFDRAQGVSRAFQLYQRQTRPTAKGH
ncbi:hypothetical protein [Leptolyngbya sp. 7M]|uniref:hypothetical protein n=1 Tax=Leptolyngbya sp. 7M TaxID=2812896 RepID=UPI001B8B090A|nr:hypothetical protein [Leptolyngbya sp. 7M]QYO68203.1 hypothetical protein JVX88_16420 [Leptolyngbya sp. 7M]